MLNYQYNIGRALDRQRGNLLILLSLFKLRMIIILCLAVGLRVQRFLVKREKAQTNN